MKRSILLLLVLVMISSLFAGCNWFTGTPNPTPTTPPTTYTLELSDTELELDVFDKAELTVTVKDNNGELVNNQEISWVSDHPEIVAVNDGKLDAMAKGTAVITASVGEFNTSCTVTVDALVRPQLMVTEAEVHIAKRQERVVIPSVKFKSEILDNAAYDITYSFDSANDSIATISEDGKIIGVGVGETQITVTANLPRATAAGIDGSLTLTINVKVLANFSMNVGIADGESSVIYLQGATDGETVYKDSSKVVVLEAIYEGNDISADIVFKSSDEEILLVDENGVVTLAPTAKVGDKATIYCQYQFAEEGVILSNSVEFTVDKANVTKPVEGEIVVDLSSENGLNVDQLFGEEFGILSVYDLEDQTKTNIWNVEGGVIDASKVALFGNRTLVIEGEKISYKINVLLVSKVITTMDEFLAIFQSSTKIPDIKADGYYILGNNIDASEAAFVGRGWYSGDGVGLVGTFDGRGYTIDGFNISSGGGIFGVVSSTATVKNVAFTNIKVNAPTSHAPVLAYAMMGTLENCYFGINELSTGYVTGTAGLFVQANDKNVIKNVVVVANCSISVPEGFPEGKYGILEAATNKGAFENVFVVSPDKLFGGSGAIDEATQYSKSVQRYTSMSELLASDYYSEKKVAYPSDIWDTATMTFKSSADVFKAELEGLPTEKELSLGEAVALLNNYNACVITSNSDKLTVSNGRVTANQLLTLADGAKVTITWGEVSKEIAIKTKNETTLAQKVYLNDANQSTITISGVPTSLTSLKAYAMGVSGSEVELTLTCENGVVSITKEALAAASAPIATGANELRLVLENDANYYVKDVTFVWVLNNATEILKMREHLTLNGSIYSGMLALGADIDLTGVTIKNHGLTNNHTFAGEFDGRNYTLSNMSLPATSGNIGLFTNVSGTIKNVKVVNGTLSTYAGLLVGGGLTGTIENVYVSGTIAADGMAAASNLTNFGAGLLAGRINAGAKINNVIVEIISMTDGLRLATAFGKLHGGSASENSFTNCYAINAADATFMPYNQGWVKKSFTTGGTNANFDSMYELWTTNDSAKALAVSLGIAEPSKPHVCANPCEICGLCASECAETTCAKKCEGHHECANPCEICGLCASECAEKQCAEKCQGHTKTEVTLTVSDVLYYANNKEGTDFVISHADLTGTPSSVTVAGIEVGGSIANGALTIPAAAMKTDTMPSGVVTIVVTTGTHIYTIEGAKVVWTINTASDVLKMKNHLTVAADGKTYSGMLALGQDIDLNGVTIKNSGLTGTIFAGEFDGRNYTLSNIAANTGNIGLFADVSGTIKNLKVTGTVSANTALIVGGALTGTIENVYVSGSITKDGMAATSNLTNFGAGLLAGRIQAAAKINNTIVELTSIADGLRLGTAFGKLHGTNNTAIFSNCYAVNAADATYMPYNQGWTKANFPTGTTNANFADMAALWENEAAAALATSLGLTK